jgi:hypothetical protein
VEALVITWRELLIVVVLVLAVYIAEVLLLTRSAGKRSFFSRDRNDKAQSSEVQSLRTDLQVLQEQVEKLQVELDDMKQAHASTPYGKAIELAQQGLNAAHVASNCGISRGEAELIVALYRSTGKS